MSKEIFENSFDVLPNLKWKIGMLFHMSYIWKNLDKFR